MNPDFELGPGEILRVLMATISPPDSAGGHSGGGGSSGSTGGGVVTQAAGEDLAKSNSPAASV